jgi:hypothetical protein
VVDDLLASADEAEGIDRRGIVLAGLLLRLKQVCNHAAHFQADGSSLHGRSGKLTRAEELLEEILDPLRGSPAAGAGAEEMAPWWPFSGGTMPQRGDIAPAAGEVQPADPTHAGAVLDGLEVLDVTVAGVPFRAAIRVVYDPLIAAGAIEVQAPG